MKSRVAVIAALLLSGVLVAKGDWDPGDPFKMHYPQLPDPTGWDVSFEGKALADDFLCTQSGPITGIHFWVSWKGDAAEWGKVTNIHLSIHEDIPAGPGIPYSRPQEPAVWERDTGTTGWAFRPYGAPSQQGWYDPATNEILPNNHQVTWQVNVPDIKDPFVQEKDKIYWLNIRFGFDEFDPGYIGWKTSVSDHFNDDAAWSNFEETWNELRDPNDSDKSLDLAFVIVPEPGTGALMLLVGAAAFARRRLRRG